MSDGVTLQNLVTQFTTGKITFPQFQAQVQANHFTDAEVSTALQQALHPAPQPEQDTFNRTAAGSEGGTPTPQAVSTDPRAAQIAQMKAASLEYQTNSPADQAVRAHEDQDGADAAMEDAIQRGTANDGTTSRQGIEAEQKRNADAGYVRDWVMTDDTTGKRVTKSDVKKAKKAFEQAKERYDAAQKAYTTAETKVGGTDEERQKAKADLDAAENDLATASREYSTLRNRYDAGRKRFLGIGSGTKRIVKAEKRNAENYGNVDGVAAADNLYVSKDAARAAGDNDAIYFSDKEARGLAMLSRRMEKKVEALDAEIAQTTDTQKKQALEQQKAFFSQFIGLARPDEQGKLDVAAIQRLIETYTGADDRLNLEDEVADLAADSSGMSKVEARKFVKKLGFGREHGSTQRWRNALIGGLAGLTSGALGMATDTKELTTVVNTITLGKKWVVDKAGTPGHYEEVDTVNGTTRKWVPGTGEEGHWADADPQTDPGTPETSKKSKFNLPGMFMPAFTSAAAAFLLTRPTTQNAFNEGEIDGVLDNARSVRGNSTASTRANRAIVQEIIDMDLSMVTTDPVRQKAIKSQVIQQAIGGTRTGTANTEELVAARDFLKFVQKNPEVLTGLVQEPDNGNGDGDDGNNGVDPNQDPNPTPHVDNHDGDDDDGNIVRPELDIEEEEETTQTEYPTWEYRFAGGKGRGGSLKDTILEMYHVQPGTQAAKTVWREFLRVNPDFARNRSIRVGDKFNVPNIEVNGQEIQPDTDVKVKPTTLGRVHGKYKHTVVTYDSKTNKYYVVEKESRKRVGGPYDTRAEAESKKTELEQEPAQGS